MLGNIAMIVKKADEDKKKQLLTTMFKKKEGFGKNFWAGAAERRAKDEREERERLAKNTKELLDRERHHRKQIESAQKVQARFRGLLVRRNTMHRHKHHHKIWRMWSVERVFNFYVQRQCEVESAKERTFRLELKKYMRARKILSRATASQLSRLLDDGEINRDELGPILDFDEASLQRARLLYINKYVIVEAERKCQEDSFSFRECLLSYLKHPEHEIFHYYNKALSFPYLVILLRDCSLLDNTTSLSWLQDCYIKRSVQAPPRLSRNQVSGACAYREYIEQRQEDDKYARSRGRIKYDSVTQPTPDELAIFLKELGVQEDMSVELMNLVDDNKRKGMTDIAWGTFCRRHKVLDQVVVDAHTSMQIAEENEPVEHDSVVSQIKIILNRHADFALRFAGFEDTLIHLAKHQHQQRLRRIKAGFIPPDGHIKKYQMRRWKMMYGTDAPQNESSSDDEESPQEILARHHLEDNIVRLHLAPTMHAIDKTATCGATSTLGQCLMQSNRYMGFLLRYERNLRSVFTFYSTQAWLRDLNKRKKWKDVVNENHRLSYVDFVRFSTEFNLYPQLLSNNIDSPRGFQLLNVFLGAKQGMRADPTHRCCFSLHNQPANNLVLSHTKARYCEICGSREFIFPRVLQIRIKEGVARVIEESKKIKRFWAKPLAYSIRNLMVKLGDDPTDAEVFYAAREAREPFEQLRTLRRTLAEAEQEESRRLETEARVAREAAREQEEMIQRIMDNKESEEHAIRERDRKAAEESVQVEDPWAASSQKIESSNTPESPKNNRRRKRTRSKSKDSDNRKEDKQIILISQHITADSEGISEETSESNPQEKKNILPTTIVRLQKLNIRLNKVVNDFEHCVQKGLCRARELKVRILSTRLSFPEFTHCLVLSSHAAFAQYSEEHTDWENPMQELFRRMDPSFAAKFGRKLDVETKDRVKSDRDLKQYIETFHNQLYRLFSHYEYSTKSFNNEERKQNEQAFLSPSAFFLLSQDCRLVKSVSQNGIMAAYEAATIDSLGNNMTSEVFITAMEALLYQDFVETGRAGNNPLAYISPITRATTMTPRGLGIRKAVSKIATLFGFYGPTSRTTTIQPGAYAQVFQHAKQKNKSQTQVEQANVTKLANCYKNAAKALIDDDDERIYEATDKLKNVVASMRGVKSYWKLLQGANSVASAVASLPLRMKQLVKKKDVKTNDLTDDTVHGPKRPSIARPLALQMSPMAHRNGKRMREMQRSILSRRKSYYQSISDTLGEGKKDSENHDALLSTHSALFSLTQLSSTMNPKLFAQLSPKRPRRPNKNRMAVTDPYLASVRRKAVRNKSSRLHHSQKAREMSAAAHLIMEERKKLAAPKEEKFDEVGHVLACIKRGLALKSTKDFDNARKEFQHALEQVDRIMVAQGNEHLRASVIGGRRKQLVDGGGGSSSGGSGDSGGGSSSSSSNSNSTEVDPSNTNKEEESHPGMNSDAQQKLQLTVVILSALCQTAAAEKDSEAALVHGNAALEICRAMADKRSTISVLGTIANCHASMQDIKTAVQIHKEQMHLAHRTGEELSALPCYADIARSYAMVQDYDNAIHQASNRLDLAKKSNQQFEIALALHDLGKLQLKCGSFKRGLKNLEQCVHLHKSDSVHQATAAIEIGHVYGRTYGEHEKALRWHTLGLECARKCRNSKYAQSEALAGIAESKMGLAAIVARQTRSGYADPVVSTLFTEASVCFEERKVLSITLNHLDEACRSDLQLGLLYQSTNQHDKALLSFANAVALADKIGSDKILLEALVEYGQQALRDISNSTKSTGETGIAHLERAIKYAKKLGRRDVLCEVQQILGRYDHAQGNVDVALGRAKESVALASTLGDPGRLSGAACLEGMCHLARKDFRAAAASFQRQLRATQVTGDRVGRTQALDGLTECYASGGKFEKAAEAAEECLSLMEGMEDVAGEINFRFKFGMVLWKLSWYKDAVANYKKIATLSARVADVKSSRDANLCLCRVMEAM